MNVPTNLKHETKQIWLKDTGPYVKTWGEAGLDLFAEFIDGIQGLVDYAKIAVDRISRDGYKRKYEIYRDAGIRTYVDHGPFGRARMLGLADEFVDDAAHMGIGVVEFWNIGEPLSDRRWKELTHRVLNHGMEVTFEFHPPGKWNKYAESRPVTADDILRAADPVLDAGASYLMLDHDTLKHCGSAMEEVYNGVLERVGRKHVVLEIESQQYWQHILLFYRHFGTDVNISNVTFDQILAVDVLRAQVERESR